jgi:hypothetical protein
MEGVHFSPPNRPDNRVHQLCSECGCLFESRPNADGAQIVCDECYKAQFEPVRASNWQRVIARLRSPRRAR